MPSGRTQVLHIDVDVLASTLAINTALRGNSKIDASRENGARITKLKLGVMYNGKASGDGPISYGISVGLTDTEIAEAILADPSGAMTAAGASDQANRKVFPLGVIPDGTRVESAEDIQIRTIHGFPFKEIDEGVTMAFYIFNHGSQLTTGLVVTFIGIAVTEWLRD